MDNETLAALIATSQQPQRSKLADFLRSEKDTRPYWETQHRGIVMPLVQSGYNNSVDYGVPGILGGSAWGTMDDILRGRQVAKGEIEHGATNAAGAAMVGSLAFGRPAGSVGSGGRSAARQEVPTVTAQRLGNVEDWSSKMGRGYVDAERHLPSTDINITSSWNGDQPGTGLHMYRALINEANRKGLSVSSDEMVSESAKHIYEALARRGHRVTRNPDAVTIDGSVFAPSGVSAFDVGPSPWATYANAPTSAAAPSLLQLAEQYRRMYGAE